MTTPYRPYSARPAAGAAAGRFAPAPATKSKKPIFIILGVLLVIVLVAMYFANKSTQAKKDYFAIYTKLSDFGRKTPEESSERIPLTDEEIKGALEQLANDPKAGDPEGGWAAVAKALSMCSNNKLVPICLKELPNLKIHQDPHHRLMYQLAKNQSAQFAGCHKEFIEYLQKVKGDTRSYVLQYCYKLFNDSDADYVLSLITSKDASAGPAEELYRKIVINSKDRSGLARKAMDQYVGKSLDESTKQALMRAAAPGANPSMLEELKKILAGSDNLQKLSAFTILSYWGKDREAFDLLLKEYDKLGDDFMAQRPAYAAMTDLLVRNHPFRNNEETFACFEQAFQRATGHAREDVKKSRSIQLSNALPPQWDSPWVRKAIELLKTSKEREVLRNADKASMNIKTRGIYKGY